MRERIASIIVSRITVSPCVSHMVGGAADHFGFFFGAGVPVATRHQGSTMEFLHGLSPSVHVECPCRGVNHNAKGGDRLLSG